MQKIIDNIRNFRVVWVVAVLMLCLLSLIVLPESGYHQILKSLSMNEDLDSQIINSIRLNAINLLLVLSIAILFFLIFSNREDVAKSEYSKLLDRRDFIILTSITLILALLNLRWLFLPITYDEAFSVQHYSSKPLVTILTDYTYYNHHILHNLINSAFVKFFGMKVWSVRLTSFLAGLACLPYLYTLIKKRCKYLPLVVLMTSLFYLLPFISEYSALARGYSLSWLILFMIIQEIEVKNRVTYLPLLLALGIYNLPVFIFLYPILLLVYFRKLAPSQWFTVSTKMILLALIFFSPIILKYGFTHILNPAKLERSDLIHKIQATAINIYYVFMFKKPLIFGLVVSSLILAGIYYSEARKWILYTFGSISLLLLFANTQIPARTFSVFIPIFYLAISYALILWMKSSPRSKVLLLTTLLIFQIFLISNAKNFRVITDFRYANIEALSENYFPYKKDEIHFNYPLESPGWFYFLETTKGKPHLEMNTIKDLNQSVDTIHWSKGKIVIY